MEEEIGNREYCMSVYVNRTLNLKHIQVIGFDMDYTVVRYKGQIFEEMAFHEILNKLVKIKNYPKEVLKFYFDFSRVIRGLIFDKKRGNLIKLCGYGKVRLCYHGTKQLSFTEMQSIYKGLVIDLNDKNFAIIDTTFSVSAGLLFMQLVDYQDSKKSLSAANPDLQSGTLLPLSYDEIFADLWEMVDRSHQDGSLKGPVMKNLEKFLIQDPAIVGTLENLKENKKKLVLITNSDYHYTRSLLDFTINPFLKHYPSWDQLFDLVITGAEKPRFFTEKRRFLRVEKDSGLMSNWDHSLEQGIYQGGNADQITRDWGIGGDQILYLGDHIYGDVLTLKRACNWRTALVVEELNDEIKSLENGKSILQNIDRLMSKKESLELIYFNHSPNSKEGKDAQQEIRQLDKEISALITSYQEFFNPYWGSIMRAGQEESRLATQIQKYACIYMGKISDLSGYSARHYFRPRRRPLPHEPV